jgi:hypothetical protein
MFYLANDSQDSRFDKSLPSTPFMELDDDIWKLISAHFEPEHGVLYNLNEVTLFLTKITCHQYQVSSRVMYDAIDAKVDVEVIECIARSHHNVMFSCATKTPLYHALEHMTEDSVYNLAILKILVDMNPEAVFDDCLMGISPLRVSFQTHNTPLIMEWLISQDVGIVNRRNQNNKTELHEELVWMTSSPREMQVLVNASSQNTLRESSSKCHTPLHLATIFIEKYMTKYNARLFHELAEACPEAISTVDIALGHTPLTNILTHYYKVSTLSETQHIFLTSAITSLVTLCPAVLLIADILNRRPIQCLRESFLQNKNPRCIEIINLIQELENKFS